MLPEPWLRGPLPGVPSLLQPAAHAFVMASEDVTTAVAGLTSEQLWREPGRHRVGGISAGASRRQHRSPADLCSRRSALGGAAAHSGTRAHAPRNPSGTPGTVDGVADSCRRCAAAAVIDSRGQSPGAESRGPSAIALDGVGIIVSRCGTRVTPHRTDCHHRETRARSAAGWRTLDTVISERCCSRSAPRWVSPSERRSESASP